MSVRSRSPSPGASAFAGFLRERHLSDARAAALLGVTDVTVYHWRSGAKIPGDVNRRKIEIFTRPVDGATDRVGAGIAPSAWGDGAEERELSAVEPFDLAHRQRASTPPSGKREALDRKRPPSSQDAVPPSSRVPKTKKRRPRKARNRAERKAA
jgi:hypothetical protein